MTKYSKVNAVKLYRSGLVQRYHQHPEMAHHGQTNSSHQWGVMMLVLALNPEPSKNLLICAATHDAGELGAGDLSGPFKREYPDFAKTHKAIEKEFRDSIVGNASKDLINDDNHWLEMCDKLEAYLYVKIRQPDLIEKRVNWSVDLEKILHLATYLGCRSEVIRLVRDVDR